MKKDEVLQYLDYSNEETRSKIKEYTTSPEDLNTDLKTIVFSTPSETGTSFFRLFEPMKAILRNFPEEVNVIYTEKIQPTHMKIADTIIMHRCGNLHSQYLNVSRYWPKTEIRPYIIHDADDNEFNLPTTHPMKDLWEQSGKDKMSIHSIKHSDAITTTTNKLKQTFSNFNRNVNVFRNNFDWNLPQWNVDKQVVRKELLPEWDLTDKIVVGWAGLTSHISDIARMAPIIKEIHDKYPQTVFVLAGMAIKDTTIEVNVDKETGKKSYEEVDITDENEKYENKVRKMFSDVDPNRIKFLRARPLEEYAVFNALFDIALAYVEHNTFNACKSEIKVVEALKYGALPIFSQFGGYKEFWSNAPSEVKENNLAISMTSAKPWINAISHWVENFEQGQKVVENLSAWSNNYYDINNNIESYLTYLIESTERHTEKQINQASKYVDYEPPQ